MWGELGYIWIGSMVAAATGRASLIQRKGFAVAWIKTVGEDDATGLLASIYKSATARAGRVYQILKVQSQGPRALRSGMGLYTEIMHGESPLTRGQREMLAVVVSKVNACHY